MSEVRPGQLFEEPVCSRRFRVPRQGPFDRANHLWINRSLVEKSRRFALRDKVYNLRRHIYNQPMFCAYNLGCFPCNTGLSLPHKRLIRLNRFQQEVDILLEMYEADSPSWISSGVKFPMGNFSLDAS